MTNNAISPYDGRRPIAKARSHRRLRWPLNGDGATKLSVSISKSNFLYHLFEKK